jgi:DNA polymerase elongation subunit (family B)
MDFYTHACLDRRRENILLRGYANGERTTEIVPFKPYIFLPNSNGSQEYRSLKGTPLSKLEFANSRECENYLLRYNGIENFKPYGIHVLRKSINNDGSSNWRADTSLGVYAYLNDRFHNLTYDATKINVMNIDIEVAADEGFPSIEDAIKPITAITLLVKKLYIVLGCGDYTPHRKDVKYIKCSSEAELLAKFIQIWQSDTYGPDIVTGWNVEFFDVPYIVNRITNVLGDSEAKKMSPHGILTTKRIEVMNREMVTYQPAGISVIDYMQLYRKFSYKMQESYKLDHIGHVELGERKLDYSEHESLLELYKNDYQKFVEYNVRDVEIVDKLDQKFKFMELVYALAYDGLVNFNDTFTSVRMWDIMIHNYLGRQNIATPILVYDNTKEKDRQIEGAYVKDPLKGMHNWVVSFDLNSLYPHLIMQYNISPDTIRGKVKGHYSIEDILDGAWDDEEIRNQIEDKNVAIAATGYVFDKDMQGFLPKMMDRIYDDRKQWKKRMLDAKQENENNPSSKLEATIAQCNSMQMAKKIQMNSAYGALGNLYFRWFDQAIAESITKSGQLSIRWMEKHMNSYLNKLFGTDRDYVIACDTDSMYITMDNLVKQVYGDKKVPVEKVVEFLDKVCTEKFEPFIDKCYEKLAKYVSAYDQKMVMKREAIANKGIWTAKKHYILNVYDNEGVRYTEPQLKMMGIEAVRSSTPTACRSSIKEALKIIMNEDNESLIEYINELRERFSTLPYEDVAFPRGVKGLTKYRDSSMIYKKGTPIHVRGSLLYNRLLDEMKIADKYPYVYEGDKVKFCYLKQPNKLKDNVISIPGTLPKVFGIESFIDYDTQFSKGFLEPIKTITESIGWEVEKRATLEAFFS